MLSMRLEAELWYSFNLTPSLGTSICCGCGPENTKKKKKKKDEEKELTLKWMTDKGV